MPENKTPTQNSPKGRTQKIEEFLLDPEKVIFESLEEFQTAVAELLDILSNVNVEELEKIQGQDGKTPERGKDYFTQADIDAFESFILDRMPKEGVDYPTRLQVAEDIRRQVAAIPRVKGDQGEQGKPGRDGKDGSPDSAEDIVKKIRSIKNTNQALKITDVRGLKKVLEDLFALEDQISEVRAEVGKIKVVFPVGGQSGEGGGEGFTQEQIQDFIASMFTAGTHSGITFTYDDENNVMNVEVTGGGGGLTEEQVEDIVNGLIVAGTGITATYNDVANTLTIALSGESFTSAMKAKVDHLTVTAATDLDTIRTKVGHISVTQAVDLDAIETRVNALDAAVVLKGTWDASAGTFPGSGSAQAGDSYVVSVAGTVNSIEFNVGDRLLAILDNASTSTYASNWLKLDYTDRVSTVAGKTGTVTLDANDVSEVTDRRYMTDAQETKLDSVESGADVTDAANVGSSIHGATAKTTPVDADTFAMIDSAASNVLKKVTWANIKATLKTYIDSMTSTFTNKRITPRIGTTASSATPTPSADDHDQYNVTALAAGATFGAPTGTPTDGQKLIIRVKDNGTARTLAYNAIYRAIGVTLPTTTVINKTIYLGMVYNAADTKWDVTAYALEA